MMNEVNPIGPAPFIDELDSRERRHASCFTGRNHGTENPRYYSSASTCPTSDA